MSRLVQTAVGLVQGGQVTFDFEPGPPQDRIWTGSFTVMPGVNPAAYFQVTVGVVGAGTAWGSWNGPSPPLGGVVQAVKGEIIEVTGFGLTLPGGTQLTCTLIGSDDQEGEAPYLWPAGGPVTTAVKPVGTTTYADLDAAFSTYAILDAAFSTYAGIDGYRAVGK